MPELPDVVVYVEALTTHLVGRRLDRARLLSPFVLRTVDPPVEAIHGRPLESVRRIGKRIALGFTAADASASAEDRRELFLVMHLMIAGRLRWRAPGQKLGMGPKLILAALEFEHGTLFFTEAGSKKRASIQMVRGADALSAVGRGGLEPLDATLDQFHRALTAESHTLKRALTDPRLFSGIGNAYSDEILHAARLSPLKLTRTLTDDDVGSLYEATHAVLTSWIERLRAEAAGRFPETVTAFHDAMAVHGRFKQPCPACGSPVQRIVYAANECNYCATCQTGGRLLADRSLSRLLKSDWPRSIDDL
jgi:formamidopyrimidine-DNA glycosylase